jgi:hypothetical protein
MTFIEISQGLFVRRDEIKVIEEVDENSCKVVTEAGVFDSCLSCSALISILEEHGEPPPRDDGQITEEA